MIMFRGMDQRIADIIISSMQKGDRGMLECVGCFERGMAVSLFLSFGEE